MFTVQNKWYQINQGNVLNMFILCLTCRISSSVTLKDLLGLLRHKSNAPAHPKTITE